jgi:Helix-turn-helix domain
MMEQITLSATQAQEVLTLSESCFYDDPMVTSDNESKPPLREAIAAEIRAHMARQRRSGRSVAFELGWKQAYMSRRLTGATPFTLDDLEALADVLGMPMRTLLEDALKQQSQVAWGGSSAQYPARAWELAA